MYKFVLGNIRKFLCALGGNGIRVREFYGVGFRDLRTSGRMGDDPTFGFHGHEYRQILLKTSKISEKSLLKEPKNLPFNDLTYDCQNLAFLLGVSLYPIICRCCLNIFAAYVRSFVVRYKNKEKKRFQYKMKDVLLNKILCRQLNIVVLLILLLSELHLFYLSCCFFLRSIIIITLTTHCEGGRTKNIRKKNFFHYNYYVATRQPLMYTDREIYMETE